VVNFLTATSERRPADVIGNAVKVTGHRRPARRHAAAADRWRSTSYTASFSFFAARKAIFLLALILIASPVAGFRPILAARFRTWGMPRPFRLIFVALLQMLRGERHQIAQNSLDLLLGEVMTFGQFGSEVLQRDGGQNRTFSGRTSWLREQLSCLAAYPTYCVRGGAPSSLSSSPPR
jgi:hypothetical protein